MIMITKQFVFDRINILSHVWIMVIILRTILLNKAQKHYILLQSLKFVHNIFDFYVSFQDWTL